MHSEPRGKVALVTGGTDGIGKEISRGLARSGYGVILVGRDAEKGERARRELRNSEGEADVQFLRADLSLVREANRLADEVSGRWPGLHRLVHCAGVVQGRRELTSEGVESNFAINYLSRFVLSERLLPLLEKAGEPGPAARIVIVGGAAQNGTIYYDDVNLTKRFGILRVVGQFCQANDLFTIELARRLGAGRERPAVTITSPKLGQQQRSAYPLIRRWCLPSPA